MGFCGKHTNVECRFFCTTCGIPVCHVCMEKGDHLISKHDCITLTKYCEAKRNEICTVLEEAKKHKTWYDKINSKWSVHLSSIEGEFDKLKNEILLTKQRLLQQLDLDEQLQQEAVEIEKAKLETAIRVLQCTHEQTFVGVYQQLKEKLQFLLRNPSTQNAKDNEAVFEECHKLSNNLHQVLSKFEEEDMLGIINVTFVPLKDCFLGKVVVPHDDHCLTDSTVDSSHPKVREEPTRKRKQTDSDTMIAISIKKEKIENPEGKLDPCISKISRASTSNTNANRLSQDGTNKTALAAKAKLSNQDGPSTSAVNTNFTHSNKNVNIKSTVKTYAQQANGHDTAFKLCKNLLSSDSHRQLPGTSYSLQAQASSVGVNNDPAHNSRQHITVDTRCSGIIWADTEWLFEVTTTKACIKVKHHKLSDGSQLCSNTIINCNQPIQNKGIRVCPKIYSPNGSFLLAFKDQIAIISLQEMKLGDVSWHRIPNTFAILAIAWRKDPSNYVAIVKGPDGRVSLMRDVSKSSKSRQFETNELSNIGFSDYHPLDISPKDEFALCNTNTGRILFFSKLGESIPTREVLAPFHLNDGKPLSVSFVDDDKKWLALWKGNSASDGLPVWVIVLYNSKFIPVSTIVQCSYRKLHEEPKAFCVRGGKIAVLYNSLRIRVHTIQRTPYVHRK